MKKAVFSYGPCWAERDGDTLTGELSYRPDGKKAARRTWRPDRFDTALTRWFAAAADQDRIEVIADLDGDGQILAIRMAHPPVFTPPEPDPRRRAAVQQRGGKPNPYTFIPTPPRTGLSPGLGNGPPAPHGVIDASTQWSGWLVLRLETTTPMLLPGERADDDRKHPTYAVRTGPDGKPLLHGASVKGALRSAYEAVTNSRYAVFRGHDRPLAYRSPAGAEKRPIEPARVEADGKGGLRFQLCDAYPVRIYDRPDGRRQRKAQAAGRARQLIASTGGWDDLHGRKVVCTMTDRKAVLEIALSDDERSLGNASRPRTRGWLSVTGHSIEGKTSERIFVPKINKTIKVEKEHHALWHAVLASYHDIAEQRNAEAGAADTALPPSRHIVADGKVPDRLAEGDLVYLERDHGAVTAIQPVYIGRLPYPAAPAELLHETLRPAADLGQLSPADRLFGWAPPQAKPGRAIASGYRGRLRITSICCETEDWRTTFEQPVTLAPLSTPKPAQFRFYASPGQDGSPMPPQAQKSEGYAEDGGLRGRKAYWYPSDAGGDYWKAGTGRAGGRFREWQEPPEAAPSQTSSHRGWVREGTAFTARLFIDAVPGTELGPLIWLATHGGCPLRLGAGKPLGFGAVTVSIDWNATELRTADALHGCWTSLRRPGPASSEQIRALAAEFEQQAQASPALAPSIAAFRAVAAGLPEPAAYPRTGQQPEAETYRWFTANEQIQDGKPEHGYALPYVLDDDQNLPYLQPSQITRD